LVRAAKAAALLDGRSFTTPDDIRELAGSVLAHRLVLSDDGDGDSRVAEQIVQSCLQQVGYRKGIRSA
jgi:MoxR-like ATPase